MRLVCVCKHCEQLASATASVLASVSVSAFASVLGNNIDVTRITRQQSAKHYILILSCAQRLMSHSSAISRPAVLDDIKRFTQELLLEGPA